MVERRAGACGICGGAFDLAIEATERMFGKGGHFWYDRCAVCGCVQLRNVPANLGDYYAQDYYAFAEPAPPAGGRRVYRRVRDAILFGRLRALRSVFGPFTPRRLSEVGEWFAKTRAGRNTRILDVGCGVGVLLRRLVDAGYAHVDGVDPFVDADIAFLGRVLVRRAWLADVVGEYDLIMFHHSLEHIADQAETMRHVARLLAPGGRCLIRVPTVSSFAWEEYRDRWVQLDAPRHLYLHSVESLERLAAGAGLRLEGVVYDSTGFQFEGSELYRRGAPLKELNEHAFSRMERWRFSRRANRLNVRNLGDQAAFYFRKA